MGKVGASMVNAKFGPAIGFKGGDVTLTAQADLGYAIMKGDGRPYTGGDLYIVVSPEIQAGTAMVLTLPVGAQYDIPTPIRGLYFYPRVTFGYSLIATGDGGGGDALAIAPAIGAKFVTGRIINFGVEPFSMPIYLGNDEPGVQYRIFGYAGLNL